MCQPLSVCLAVQFSFISLYRDGQQVWQTLGVMATYAPGNIQTKKQTNWEMYKTGSYISGNTLSELGPI